MSKSKQIEELKARKAVPVPSWDPRRPFRVDYSPVVPLETHPRVIPLETRPLMPAAPVERGEGL